MEKETKNKQINHRFSVAPMLDWTDKHCRYFHRLMTKYASLYTEMVTTGAILHGKGDYLTFNKQEQPVVLQLGGCQPQELAQSAELAYKKGYDALNLNVGCPSGRVKNGHFGACLMAEKQQVSQCVAAMQQASPLPVSIKTRIGIDEQDSYTFLADFVDQVAHHCQTFIIHARKAWLTGLSPKENREIPPLNYERVYQIKKDFPHLTIIINGGIQTLEQAKAHLKYVDGVMVGRAVYQNPSLLLDVDQQLFGAEQQVKTAVQIVKDLYPYIEQQLSEGIYLNHITRHLLGLFQGVRGAKQWRRYLSEHAHQPDADIRVIEKALSFVEK